MRESSKRARQPPYAALGIEQPVAGKTGTTEADERRLVHRISPDLIAGVWSDSMTARRSGYWRQKAALPIWVAFMKEALPAYPVRPFDVPRGVVFRDVDRRSGLLSGVDCGESSPVHEAFVRRDATGPRLRWSTRGRST